MNAQINRGEVDRVKDKVRISEVVGQYVTFDRKKSLPRRGVFWAACPFHGEKTPSFKCDDTKGAYYCFGCGAKGDVLSFLKDHDGISFSEAIKRLGGDLKAIIPPERKQQMEQERETRIAAREAEKEQDDAQRSRVAKAIFMAGKPIGGTLAESYLTGRGIPAQEWDKGRFRYLSSAKYDLYPSLSFPALIAAVTNAEDQIVAIHRTYLDPETAGKARVPEGMDPKLAKGPSAGGAVRIGGVSAHISVCEGIETAFGIRALQQAVQPVWALLGTSGMRGVLLPPEVKHVDVWADGDMPRFDETGKLVSPPGTEAANDLIKRLKAEKRTWSLNVPGEMGDDYLDVWNAVRE